MRTALKHVVMCQLVGFKIQSTHERMVGLWWFGYQIASRAVDNRNEKRKLKTEQVRWIDQISGVLLAKPLSSCGHSIGQQLAQDGWSLVACIGSFAFNIFHRWQAAVYGLTFNYTIYMVDSKYKEWFAFSYTSLLGYTNPHNFPKDMDWLK